jgi:hypothetical protein
MGKFGAANSYPVSNYRNRKTATGNQILLTNNCVSFHQVIGSPSLTFHTIDTQ